MTSARRIGVAAAGLFLGAVTAAGFGLPLPFLHRGGGPKIQTWVFLRSEDLDLTGDRVGVFDFPIPSHASPAPPRLGELLYQGLLAKEAAKEAVYLEGVSGGPGNATAAERIAAAAQYGRQHRMDAVALGRVDALFVRSAGGLIVEVTLRVVSTKSGEMLWYGKKRAHWSRYVPLEDGFRTIARSFLKDLGP
jgi:hypothetical protein